VPWQGDHSARARRRDRGPVCAADPLLRLYMRGSLPGWPITMLGPALPKDMRPGQAAGPAEQIDRLSVLNAKSCTRAGAGPVSGQAGDPHKRVVW
jgi:hypothetical protein